MSSLRKQGSRITINLWIPAFAGMTIWGLFMQNLLTVGGFDPTGSAGVIRDLTVFKEYGFHGSSIITNLTAQNDKEVLRADPVPINIIKDSFKCVPSPLGIKIGLLSNDPKLIDFLQEFLNTKKIFTIYDPVIKSSSGFRFLSDETVENIKKKILPSINVLTPNLFEAEMLSGKGIKNIEDALDAAKIIKKYGSDVIIKGGHFPDIAVDILYDGKNIIELESKKYNKNIRGTGCMFASSFLCEYVKEKDVKEAFKGAKKYINKVIQCSGDL